MSPKFLDQVLARVPGVRNENVLVGFETADDAGVYKLSPECALVQTVDFFTPMVDDAYTFGAVAAANALSDVYAMGGKPVSALTLVAYPGQGEADELVEILRGGADKMREADCIIVGGHSVADQEIKFGYAVTGLVHPDRVWRNSGARAGDALLFTKRLGTGVIATALKRGLAAEEHVRGAVDSMLMLNRAAREAMLALEIHGCTDVSGFGLLGHAREMALASGVTLEIDPGRAPLLPGAAEYARRGAIPGGLRNNRDFVACAVEAARELPPELDDLLYDPQTSGGLLIALPEPDAALLEKKLAGCCRIGRVVSRQEKPIRLL